MRRSAAFIALSMALFVGCYDEGTTCVSDLACANQEGLIATCCAPEDDGTSTCWYEAPDGVVFTCDPIVDEANVRGHCAQAVDDLTAHCSE